MNGSKYNNFPISFNDLYSGGTTMSDYLGRTDLYLDSKTWFLRTNSTQFGMTSYIIAVGI